MKMISARLMDDRPEYLTRFQSEADAIAGLIERLGPDFERAVEMLASCKGRVVLTGMGKSGIVCRKIAATFSSTEKPGRIEVIWNERASPRSARR